MLHGILGSGSQKIGPERAFVYRLPQSYRFVRLKLGKNCSKMPKIGGNLRKRENSGNSDVYGDFTSGNTTMPPPPGELAQTPLL